MLPSGPPDAKTRKYDRQLRLWAATGQAALEGARLLVIGATATSTSVLKNLVLPGIGHFTILDPNKTTPEDVGNNFFLEVDSIGKPKAAEATRLLSELNGSVQSAAEIDDIADILEKKPEYLAGYTLVVTHNLPRKIVDKLAAYLWSDPSLPSLIVVKTAGFLAEFFIQCHEHTVIDSHSEEKVSLRIDNPFPALLEKASSIHFDSLDQTTHAHVPYLYILIHAAAKWRSQHNDSLPKTFAERKAFQRFVEDMKVKIDEENFDEASAQAFRVLPQPIPFDILKLFDDPILNSLGPESKPFFHLLSALKEYVLGQEEGKRTLPLSANLPDIKSDTKSYVEIQTMYKARAREERDMFKQVLVQQLRSRFKNATGGEAELLQSVGINEGLIDDFVKNSHGLKVLRSTLYGEIDKHPNQLRATLEEKPREAAVHLAFAALDTLPEGTTLTPENLREAAKQLLGGETEISEDVENCLGEIARAPYADLPTTAGFVGGLVAQEAIKLITKQYISQVEGTVVVDLISSFTGSLPTPSGPSDNFIHLAINITYVRQFSDKIGYYVKDAKFAITTPSIPGSVGSNSSSATASGSSNSPAVSESSSSTGENSGQRNSSRTQAIVGGVVGGVALIAICGAVGFYVGRLKSKRRAKVSRGESNHDERSNGAIAGDAPPPATPVFVIPASSPRPETSNVNGDAPITSERSSASPSGVQSAIGLDLFGPSPSLQSPLSLPPPPYDYDDDALSQSRHSQSAIH
ncbi:hypothetical protein FRC17_001486 [Serendipita sp. 399]|nr:hypothetical protein FRC17_001486 [Serendipita sp. 399]